MIGGSSTSNTDRRRSANADVNSPETASLSGDGAPVHAEEVPEITGAGSKDAPAIVGECPDREGETFVLGEKPLQKWPHQDRMFVSAACDKLGLRTGKMACPGIWKPEERQQACLHSISSRNSEPDESCQVDSEQRGSIEVTEGAGVVKIRRPVPQKGGSDGGGKRGPVTHFSKKSARRLQLRIAKIRREQRPVFVSLTYPDVYPWSGSGIKKHIKNLGERFKREFPHWSYFWKLELQERKSGTMEGETMPHFHLLVWTNSTEEVPHSVYETVKRWFEKNWHDIIRKSLDGEEWAVLQSIQDYQRTDDTDLLEDHAEASTRTERIRSRRGVLSYVSEYMADPEKGGREMEGIGRFWGYVNKEKLPFGRTHVLPLNHAGACKMMRAIMRAEGRDYEGLPTARSHISPDATPWYKWARRLFGRSVFEKTLRDTARGGPIGSGSNT